MHSMTDESIAAALAVRGMRADLWAALSSDEHHRGDGFRSQRRAAAKLGYSNMPVVSGAGHDAVYMAKLAPSAGS